MINNKNPLSVKGRGGITCRMKQRDLSYELYLLNGLRKGDQNAFSTLFTIYYKDLVMFGGNFLTNRKDCEDIVQSIFLKLWNDREVIKIETALKSYLLTAVRNGCLNELRRKGSNQEDLSVAEQELNGVINEYDTANYILYSDLNQQLEMALSKLSPAVRETFELNKFEGLRYKEIAERLSVSERTVEVRIANALKFLRVSLKEFYMFTSFLFISYIIK